MPSVQLPTYEDPLTVSQLVVAEVRAGPMNGATS